MSTLVVGQLQAQSNVTKSTLHHLNELSDAYRKARFEAYRSEGKINADSIPKPPVFQELYLYPSVVRAFNVENNPDWIEATRGMRKLVAFTVTEHKEAPVAQWLHSIPKRLIEEGFDLWLEMAGETTMLLFVKEVNQEIVGCVYVMVVDHKLTLVDYVGNIDPLLLMKFTQNPQEMLLNGVPEEFLNLLPTQ